MQPHPKTANGCSKDISSYPTHLEKRITRRRLEKDQHVSFLYRWLEMWSGIGQMGGGVAAAQGYVDDALALRWPAWCLSPRRQARQW